MKVTIQHTIDADNIPEKLDSLMENIQSKLHEDISCRLVNANRLVKTGNREKVIFAIQDLADMKEALQDVATLYDDVLSIISGYVKVLDHVEHQKLAKAAQVTEQLQGHVANAAQTTAPTSTQKQQSKASSKKTKTAK